MTFIEQLGDTFQDTVGAFGDGLQNAQSEAAVRIKQMESQRIINEQQAQANIKTRDRVESLIVVIAYGLVFLALATGFYYFTKKLR